MHGFFYTYLVPGNIHSGVSGNDSIMATGVFSARELLRVTRRKFKLGSLSEQQTTNYHPMTKLKAIFNMYIYRC